MLSEDDLQRWHCHNAAVCQMNKKKCQDKNILKAGLATAYLAELLHVDRVRDLLPQVRFKKVQSRTQWHNVCPDDIICWAGDW